MGISLLYLGLSTKTQNNAASMSGILTFLIIYQATQGSYFWSYTCKKRVKHCYEGTHIMQ